MRERDPLHNGGGVLLASENIATTRRIELLGMSLDAIDGAQLIAQLLKELALGRGGWVVTVNLDKLQRFVADPDMRALISQADLRVADGMPLLWAAQLQGTPLPGRVAGSDLVWGLTEQLAETGHRLYLLGGAADAGARSAERFVQRWPNLQIAGISSPMLSLQPSENELAEVRAQLAAAKPDVVYVGFGAPKEERVIDALRRDFPATWFIGIGVSLSFVAGDVLRAPVWMQRCGIEWFHRMLQDPRRLGQRYLKENLFFLPRLLLNAWRARS